MMKHLLPPYSVLSGVNENICAFLLVFSRIFCTFVPSNMFN